jgi:DNA-binding response OmpR family regulator
MSKQKKQVEVSTDETENQNTVEEVPNDGTNSTVEEVAKPFNKEELIAKVEKSLQGAKGIKKQNLEAKLKLLKSTEEVADDNAEQETV